MTIAREETFGPVMPLLRFDSDAEAVAMANDTEFGLAAYLFSRTPRASGARPRRWRSAWSASIPG